MAVRHRQNNFAQIQQWLYDNNFRYHQDDCCKQALHILRSCQDNKQESMVCHHTRILDLCLLEPRKVPQHLQNTRDLTGECLQSNSSHYLQLIGNRWGRRKSGICWGSKHFGTAAQQDTSWRTLSAISGTGCWSPETAKRDVEDLQWVPPQELVTGGAAQRHNSTAVRITQPTA